MGRNTRQRQGNIRKRNIGYLSTLQDYRQSTVRKPVKPPPKSFTFRKHVPVKLPKKITKFGKKISSKIQRRVRPKKYFTERRPAQLNPAAALVLGLPGLLGKFVTGSPHLVSLIFWPRTRSGPGLSGQYQREHICQYLSGGQSRHHGDANTDKRQQSGDYEHTEQRPGDNEYKQW